MVSRENGKKMGTRGFLFKKQQPQKAVTVDQKFIETAVT